MLNDAREVRLGGLLRLGTKMLNKVKILFFRSSCGDLLDLDCSLALQWHVGSATNSTKEFKVGSSKLNSGFDRLSWGGLVSGGFCRRKRNRNLANEGFNFQSVT